MKSVVRAGLALVLLWTPGAAQVPTVGVFTDASGTDCSIVAGESGVLDVYVCVESPPGVSAVEFMAPKPDCFNATYLGETSPFPTVIGNSQTGVAVALGGCRGTSAHVLTIAYMVNGPTPTCCVYPTLPSPGYAEIRVVDCNDTIVTAQSVASTINGDETCFCGINPAPAVPSNPNPGDGRVAVDVATTLAWQSTDPQGDPLAYDVYFGTVPDPPLVAADLDSAAYSPDILNFDTQYHWRVVVRDNKGNEVSGPEWRFTTAVSSNARLVAPDLLNYCGPATSDSVRVDVRVVETDYPIDGGGFDLEYDPAHLVFAGWSPGELTQDWADLSCSDLGTAVRVAGSDAQPIPAGTSGTFVRLVFLSDCCGVDSVTASGLCPDRTAGDLRALWPVCGKFECAVFSADGDVNDDGAVTPGDALCALNAYLVFPDSPGDGCGKPGWDVRSDVDCSGVITPADALCIFHSWLDGSCAFCDGAPFAVAERGGRPSVAVGDVSRTGEETAVTLLVSGVGELDAFGFDIRYPAGTVTSASFSPAQITAGFDAVVLGGRREAFARVGAYAADPAAIAGSAELLKLRFVLPPGPETATVTIDGFVDDLAGAGALTIDLARAGARDDTRGLTRYVLYQNHPNPFNPDTEIRYAIPHGAAPGRVTLTIYDVKGDRVRRLADKQQGAGVYGARWDGRDDAGETVASGVYFYALRAGGRTLTRKMVLLR